MDLIREACKLLKLVLQARAPYDTGNLAINSIRIVENSVVIGGEIADYAIYTNEPWTNKSAKNPNEGWVKKAIAEATPLIQRALSGKATSKDVKNSQQMYKQIIQTRKEEYKKQLIAKREKLTGE